MIRFKTESGGTYLVDDEKQQFKRVEGPDHVGEHPDGEWHKFAEMHLALGQPALFLYPSEGGRARYTTPVAEIWAAATL